MARRKNSRVKSYFLAKTIVVLAFFPCLLFGQQQSVQQDSLGDWTTLQEVEVNAFSLTNTKFEYAGMIGTINAKKLQFSDPAIASVEINKIPGVYWHSGALNTNRITIRGIGSRSPFSTNKIRAYYEDIPLTDGGGETTLEDVDLSFVGGIEVQKGANSSIYGSGLGGTIFLKKKEVDHNSMKTNFSLGSFGFVRAGVVGSISAAEGVFRMGYQSQTSDGYRDNNAFDRKTFSLSYSLDLEKDQINFIGLFLEQRAFIPSSLGISDFNENPRNAAFTWGAARGFEDYDRWLFGVSWSRDLTDESKLTTSIYTVGRDAFEPRPFNILEESKLGVGLRSRYEKAGDSWSMNIGFEGYKDTYKAKTFENLLPTDGSQQGLIISQTKHPRSYLNLFFDSKFEITQSTLLSAGANLNVTSYEIENVLPAELTSSNTLNPILSPRISVTQSFGESFNAFATMSHGFSSLSVDDSTDPDGSLNDDIKPETGWNREVGIKLADRRTNLELSFYSMSIINLLVTRRTAEDIIFGINAGKTRHNGLEFDFESLILAKKNTHMIADLSYSLSDFEFREFLDDLNDFSGNQLTGVPRHQFTADLRLESRWFFSGVGYQFVDEMPITDENSVFSDSYQLVNLYTGVDLTFRDRWNIFFIFRLNNVFDEKYASMLGINANSFGGSEPRYYYPGLPLNFQTSASIAYRL